MTKKQPAKPKQGPPSRKPRSALEEVFMSIPALPKLLTDHELDEFNGRHVVEEFMRESRDPERWGPPHA
jgi:hypothetical protein